MHDVKMLQHHDVIGLAGVMTAFSYFLLILTRVCRPFFIPLAKSPGRPAAGRFPAFAPSCRQEFRTFSLPPLFQPISNKNPPDYPIG